VHEKNSNFKLKQQIAAPIPEVYSAFTNASGLSEWLCSVAQIDAVKGGRVYLWWENGYYSSGEYVDLIPGDRVVFSWHGKGEPGTSRVKVTFKPHEDGSLVTVNHQELGTDKSWKQARKAIKRGWLLGLENLKSVLETGEDLRFSKRPMLGFTSMQELSKDEAKQAGLPGRAGLLVLGVMDGMCAEQAGMQAGDLLVRIAGQKVARMVELNTILNQHRAGNVVKLIFYRNGKKMTGKGALSLRPMPAIPEDAEALAQLMSKLYDQLNADLDSVLAELSEDQIDLRITPSSWSIRETLGHLIASEREMHGWISRLIEGQEADYTLRSNQPVRVRATISAFPNLASLVAELKRNQAETVAMVADLPVEFTRRRRNYWRLAIELLQTPPLHYQEHLVLIRTVVEKARLERPTLNENSTEAPQSPPLEVSLSEDHSELVPDEMA